jgi:hypothetical protein
LLKAGPENGESARRWGNEEQKQPIPIHFLGKIILCPREPLQKAQHFPHLIQIIQ